MSARWLALAIACSSSSLHAAAAATIRQQPSIDRRNAQRHAKASERRLRSRLMARRWSPALATLLRCCRSPTFARLASVRTSRGDGGDGGDDDDDDDDERYAAAACRRRRCADRRTRQSAIAGAQSRALVASSSASHFIGMSERILRRAPIVKDDLCCVRID